MAPRHNEAPSIAYRILQCPQSQATLALMTELLEKAFYLTMRESVKYPKRAFARRNSIASKIISFTLRFKTCFHQPGGFYNSKCQTIVSSNGDCSQLEIYARGRPRDSS